MERYISSLPEEPYVNLTQNNVSDLITIWEYIDQAAKESFRSKYGNIAALIAVVIDEPLLGAAIRFWDPSHRCFTFNKEDLTPIIEKYSIMVNLKLPSPDKVYVRKPKLGFRKKLADVLEVKARTLNPPWEQKGCHIGLPWVFLRDFIYNHLNEENGLAAFALAIYGLLIFPQVLGHIEVL